MSQHDQILNNDNGFNFRSDINNALAALFSSSSSNGTEPSVKQAGQLWFDTSTGILKLRDATNAVWLNLMSTAQNSSVNGTRAGSGSSTPGTINTWTKINIVTLGNNIGGWTLSSGMMVAPIKGIYLVTASINASAMPVNSATYVGIGVNSSTTAARSVRIWNFHASAAVAQTFSCTGQVSLNVGDTLALMFNESSLSAVTDGADSTFLCASLISPT